MDDEELQLKMRKLLFESADFQVVEARSEEAALESFRTLQIDAVVMDFWLSGRNGIAVAEEMKRSSPNIPIVMLSGVQSVPVDAAVVDAWIPKAEIEPEELVRVVKELIESCATQRHTHNTNELTTGE